MLSCLELAKLIDVNTSVILFRCEKILDFVTVAFSFVYGKYYPIID
jgi:hypothetical protein